MKSKLIIILNWNNSELTIDLLKQFKLKDDNCDYCIVDNNSEKKDVNNLKNFIQSNNDYYIGDKISEFKETHEYYLILNNSNDGYAKGNNLGAKLGFKLNYSYLIFSNNDIKLVEPVINKLISKLENNKLAVLVGPKIETVHGNIQGPFKKETLIHNFVYPLLFPIVILFKKFGNNFISRLASTQLKNKNDKLYRVMGCFFAVKTKIFSELGYFDDKTFLFYEEAILSAKIFKRNLEIIYYPEIKVIHLDSMSTKMISNKVLNYTIESGKYYFEEYRNYNGIKLFLFSFGKKLLNNFWLKIVTFFKKINS
jgi:GT2 family glycosyltransferase